MKQISFRWSGKTYTIKNGQRPLVIAEAGVNHNGDIKIAKKLVDLAKKAGADFVKFQTFHPDEMATPTGLSATYIRRGSPRTKSWHALLQELELPDKSFEDLSNYCKNKGIIFLSTPYDKNSVDLLEKIDVPMFKIASTDISNLPLIEYIAKKKKPLIISTGLSTIDEVKNAVNTCRKAGNKKIILLQCTSNYPASIASANIKVISTYRENFGVMVGYSDHTNSIIPAILSVSEGAVIIERHITLDKNLPGPDQKASDDPKEIRSYIDTIFKAYQALGKGEKKVMPEEKTTKALMQKSLTSLRNIKKGESIKREDILIRRPATGIPPSHLKKVIGKIAARNIAIDKPIKFLDVRW